MSRVLLRNARLRFVGAAVVYALLDTGDLDSQSDDINLQYVSSESPQIDPFVRAGFNCHRRYAMLAIDRMDEAVKIVDMTEETFQALFKHTKAPGAKKQSDFDVVLKAIWMDTVWLRIRDPIPTIEMTRIDDTRYNELLGMQETVLREQRSSLNYESILKLINVGKRKEKVMKREPLAKAIELIETKSGNLKDQVFKPAWAKI